MMQRQWSRVCWRGRFYQAAVSFKWGEAKNAGEPFIKAAVVSSRNSEGHFLSSDAPRVLIIFQKGSERTRRKSRCRGEVGMPGEAVWSRVILITVKVQPRF